MLHSSLGSKSQWTPLAERLARRFRVIAIDLCGYGDNPIPSAAEPFTLDDEVALVAAHLDRLVASPARVHVVGHSYAAWSHCDSRSARASGSQACRCTSRWHFACWGNMTRLSRTLSGSRIGSRASWLRGVATRPCRRSSTTGAAMVPYAPAAAAGSDKHGAPDRQGTARLRGCVALAAARGDLCSIVALTLLLGGTRSPAVAQRIVALLARALSNHRTWWFDAGHMAPIDQADRIKYRIENLWKRAQNLPQVRRPCGRLSHQQRARQLRSARTRVRSFHPQALPRPT